MYPLYDTFVSAPAAGYITALGGMSASHNSEQQSIDISASSTQSILRFNEAPNGDFWFEADLELLTDPSAQRHIGLWMTTGNGSEGYRFAHLNNAWGVTRWGSGFSDGAAVTGSVNDGSRPMSDSAGVAPTFNVGQRMVLRCEVITGAPDANGVPWIRLIRFSAGGVVMTHVTDATYRGKLVPGVFLYGATARIHAIAGDTPSGLPALPDTIGVNSNAELRRLNSPASDRWDDPGGYDFRIRAIPAWRKDIHFGGNGVIAGTVKEKGNPDRPLKRRVQLFSENTRLLVAETWSDANGDYRFEVIDPNQRYTVISYDHEHLYRAVIADNIRPERMP